MNEAYRLHIKIGTAEFNAEGPEQRVREDYQNFLDALKASPPATKLDPPKRDAGEQQANVRHNGAVNVSEETLNSVFSVNRDSQIVSLKLLLPDGPTRDADCVLLLLYGFKTFLDTPDVPVTKLMGGLRESGITVERLDRIMGSHSQWFIKGGTRIGGRYRLNNPGILKAEEMLNKFLG